MSSLNQRKVAVATLRAAGLRVTSPRVAVLDAVERHPHATVNVLTREARQMLGSVSKQAVYDALDTFTDTGLVRPIEPSGSPVRYETRSGDNHHHMVCRSCGTVVDVDCTVGSAPCLTPPEEPGFAIDEAEVVFWGHCSTCQSTPVSKDP